MTSIRVATYNVHKCRGMDRRVQPARVAAVMREVRADVWAVQEVLDEQARELAAELGYHLSLGHVRMHRHSRYGNAVLSRFAVRGSQNYDVTVAGYEQRGCLRVDLDLGAAGILHVFNVHLGTGFLERRHQGRHLLSSSLLRHAELSSHRVVLGDFNEWTRGLTTELMAHHFECADARLRRRWSRTYPGLFPLLRLDHIYYDDSLCLERLTAHRSRAALLASDHLPLSADFAMPRRASA